MNRTPILAVVGPKGGVGKTTIAGHLAAALGTRSRPALLADLDPQGALTEWLLPDPTEGSLSADLAAGRPMRTYPAPYVPTVRVAPADLDLAEWDTDFEGTRAKLPGALRATGDASAIVADLPPSWGALMASTLLCADGAVVIAEARRLGLTGLGRVLDLIDRAREQNRKLRLLGIVPCRVSRTRMGREVEEELRERYRQTLPSIRDSIRVAECAPAHQTLWERNLDHPVVDDMRALALAVRRALRR